MITGAFLFFFTTTTAGLRVFLEKLECAPTNPLVVTHCTRDDIVLGFLAHARNSKEVFRNCDIFFGAKSGLTPSTLFYMTNFSSRNTT